MIKNRINKIRQALIDAQLDAYYFNTYDEHLSEYVPEYYRTIAYFSGFTGSLAVFIVDREGAYLFVDGRYHLQADMQVSSFGIQVMKLGSLDCEEVDEFILKRYKRLGVDGKRTDMAFVSSLQGKVELVSVDLYSQFIENRVPMKKDPLFKLAEKYCGERSFSKLEKMKKYYGKRCHIISDLVSIAYLLNLRSFDVACTPVFVSFLVLYQGDFYLFIDKERLDSEIADDLYANGVIIRDYDDFYPFIRNFKQEIVVIDDNKTNYEIFLSLREHNELLFARSYSDELKSIKNEIEIRNIAKACLYDGVAMVRFLKWLKENDMSEFDEYQVSEYLKGCRLNYRAFDLSFSSIVAYQQNAAIVHYGPNKEKAAKLANEGILLIDSGGQYFEGTTDITRTIALGPVNKEVRKHYTTVLRSMLAFADLVFPEGLRADQLDVIARQPIWALRYDYRHGTGHGIGHVTSVHDNPPNVRYMNTALGLEKLPMRPGYVFSDEPGLYLDNQYGIRLENMLLCEKDEANEYGQFLRFRHLTLCPFDLELIDKEYLDEHSRQLLNDYHKEVYLQLSPYLNEEEKLFLKEVTRAI